MLWLPLYQQFPSHGLVQIQDDALTGLGQNEKNEDNVRCTYECKVANYTLLGQTDLHYDIIPFLLEW